MVGRTPTGQWHFRYKMSVLNGKTAELVSKPLVSQITPCPLHPTPFKYVIRRVSFHIRVYLKAFRTRMCLGVLVVI